MAENSALLVNDVSLKFNLGSEKIDSLKTYVIKLLHRKIQSNEFWGLKHINFELKKGDRLGILGFNGAGKSTLLKVIAGVYKPTTGSVERHGVLAPLLELGAGFDGEYTLRENIFLYGTILGYSKPFIENKYDEIIAFSELKKFEHVPVKNFSSGMKSRLGFSICTAIQPDILILDEVLSVGDAPFRKKSEAKIMDLLSSGVTVLFVSHSLEQVKKICNKAMILVHGEQKAFGQTSEVSKIYEKMISDS